MTLTTLGPREEGSCAHGWHTRWWPLKVLVWLFLLFVPFFIPLVVFEVYGEIAIVGSAFFLVIQLVSIINFIYVWNDAWLENEKMHVWMVVVSVVCYALTIAGIVLMYIFFAPRASCGLNIFFITFTLILIVAFTAISILPQVNAGPLTSGVMALYLVFLCWSSIMSEPPSETCNTRPRQGGYGNWLDIVGLLIALFSIAISVYSTGIDSRCMSLSAKSVAGDAADADDGGEPYSLPFFHLVFALGAMYLAMLFLGWDLTQSPSQWSIDSGWFSVWVKMVLLWVSALLYVWTLVAPFVLSGRDFS